MTDTAVDPISALTPRLLTRLDAVVVRAGVALATGVSVDATGDEVALDRETLDRVGRWARDQGAALEDTLVAAAGPVVAQAIVETVGEAWAAEAEAVADLAVAATCATLLPACASLRHHSLAVTGPDLGVTFADVVCSPQSVWLV